MSVLEELEQTVRQVADQVGPSVVGIGRGRGRGSGVVLADGLVATNAHNLRGEETTVVFAGDRSVVGRVAGVDVDADLAVIAVDTGGAPAIAWATDAEARVGSAVFALANPGRQLRVTFGLVSAAEPGIRGPRGRPVGLPERDGLLVRVVEDGGPADRAGLRTGDLLVEAGGRPVTDADELYEVLDQVTEGETLTLRVVRGTDELTVTVSFGESGPSGWAAPEPAAGRRQ